MEETVSRHAAEIAQIISEHEDKARLVQLPGIFNASELVAVRQSCSRLIAEACERHRVELNAA